jgi:hypothetical protein
VSADKIDTTVAHPARRYDYWLGGKDNFAADRESGDAIARMVPTVRIAAQENRRFMRRAVHYLAGEAGISQFLDIGSGIPTSPNLHEVAQSILPSARVVYADNDPVVLLHARALLTGSPEGALAYLSADLREPDTILRNPELLGILDLGEPVALMLVAVLHFIADNDEPYGIVSRLVGALAPGSALVLSHVTSDHMPPEAVAAARVSAPGTMHGQFRPRTRGEVARFLDGLDLVPPGLVSVADWRAEDEPAPRPTAEEVSVYGAVARKA